jgi:hypothetical protein
MPGDADHSLMTIDTHSMYCTAYSEYKTETVQNTREFQPIESLIIELTIALFMLYFLYKPHNLPQGREIFVQDHIAKGY